MFVRYSMWMYVSVKKKKNRTNIPILYFRGKGDEGGGDVFQKCIRFILVEMLMTAKNQKKRNRRQKEFNSGMGMTDI